MYISADFYFNNVYVGVVNVLKVGLAHKIKNVINYGPKVVVSFKVNKNIFDQWFVLQKLDDQSFVEVKLETDSIIYKIRVMYKRIKYIPIIDSTDWLFRIKFFEGEGVINVIKK